MTGAKLSSYPGNDSLFPSLCSAFWIVTVLPACGETADKERSEKKGEEPAGGSGGDQSADPGGSEDISDGFLNGDGDSVEAGGCRREVSLQDVTLTTPPPFDVIVVADNSESLSWSREDLAQGLSELVANVHGHDVRFNVLSPTQYGENSEDAIDLKTGEALVKWRDPVSLAPYTSPVTRYVQTCTDELGQDLVCPGYPLPNLDFELEGHWQFMMPEPVAELHSLMTTEELDAEQNKVLDAILELGIHGAPEEQPLCTLTRYLKQAEVHLPERAVFLVIADEDDTTSAEDCLEGYQFAHISSVNYSRDYGCTGNCDGYVFAAYRSVSENTLNYACAPVDDLGEIGPEETWQARSLARSNTNDCSDGPSRPCSVEEEALVSSKCDLGYALQSCTKECVQDGTRDVCSLSSTDHNVDYCTQPFEVGATIYQNLDDFCLRSHQETGWGTCSKNGFVAQDGDARWLGDSKVRPVIRVNSAGDLIHLFHSDADRIFGPDNYFVESIVFEPGGVCTPSTGQSYATELMKISSSPEQVYPICESYAPALTHVNQFAQELLQTEYTVVLEDRESIEGITVTSRDGTSRELAPDDYHYDEASSLLQIEGDAIRSSDLDLAVEVLDPCVPVVR